MRLHVLICAEAIMRLSWGQWTSRAILHFLHLARYRKALERDPKQLFQEIFNECVNSDLVSVG